MGMFDNYENVPDSYIPCNRKPDIRPCIPTKPLEIYNAKNEFIGYGWDYGDSIILEFITTGEVVYEDMDEGKVAGSSEDAETYLKNGKFNFKIYNFRYEVVFDATIDAATDVKIEINKENSEKLVKGTYTFILSLIKEDTEYHLLDNDKCILYIK